MRYIESYHGLVLAQAKRLSYVYKGERCPPEGDLELVFEGGRILLLEGAGDGTTLRLQSDGWEDPFREPLSPEQRAYVDEYGKWTLFNVSDNEPYSAAIGSRLKGHIPITCNYPDCDIVHGVSLLFESIRIDFYVEDDESYVEFSSAGDREPRVLP